MDKHYRRYQSLRETILGGYFATALGPAGSLLNVNTVTRMDNPLMGTGLLLSCLSVEFALGSASAGALIDQTLASVGSLYKQGGALSGYPLRSDPVSAGLWTTVDSAGSDIAHNFYQDETGAYIYAASTYDHRSPVNIPSAKFAAWSADEQSRFGVRWMSYVHQYRSVEPSGDEILGLAAGYGMAFELVPGARPEIKRQVAALATYLADGSYFLRRPQTAVGVPPGTLGLVARGAALGTIAGEEALAALFTQITGDPHYARVDTSAVLNSLGIWHVVRDQWAALSVVGVLTAPLVAPLLQLVESVLGLNSRLHPAGRAATCD